MDKPKPPALNVAFDCTTNVVTEQVKVGTVVDFERGTTSKTSLQDSGGESRTTSK